MLASGKHGSARDEGWGIEVTPGKRLSLVCGAAALLAIVGPRAIAQSPETLTSRERSALSERSGRRAIEKDLLSILGPTAVFIGGGFGAHRAELFTHPHGTALPGLCRRDAITLVYGEVGSPASRRADRPLRPHSLETRPLFHAVRAPDAAMEASDSDGDADLWDPACARLANADDVTWFSTEDGSAEEAGLAVLWLRSAVQQIHAGTLAVKSCDVDLAGYKTCADMLVAKARIDDINSVEDCRAESGLHCVTVAFGGRWNITIIGRTEPGSLAPAAIVSVEIGEYLIVA